jgi:hypothetical protein
VVAAVSSLGASAAAFSRARCSATISAAVFGFAGFVAVTVAPRPPDADSVAGVSSASASDGVTAFSASADLAAFSS